MILFREKRCCAIAWNGTGDYVGIVADRRGDRVQVQRVWSASDSKRSPAEMLREGYAELGSPSDALVLIGGSIMSGYFKELQLPKMSTADLARAVEFELPKHCPLPVDSVRWGIRLLGDAPDGQKRVRLTVIPDHDWTAWLEAASGIGRGVDMIIPPASTLDPLLGDKAVCLGYDHERGSFMLTPEADGERGATFIESVHDHPDTFGLGPRPLEAPNLKLGPLEEMMPEDAAHYTPVILLAMYGLSRQYLADKRLWLEVPRELRPRRNRLLKVTAALMLVFLVVSGAYLGATHYFAANRRQAQLDAQRRLLNEHLAAYQAGAKLDSQIDELEVAMMDNLLSYRSLPEAMLELSTTLDHDVHAARMSWNDGSLALTLSSMVDRPDLLVPLSQSELFTNFHQLKKELRRDGSVLFQVEMKQKNAHQLSAAVDTSEGEEEEQETTPAAPQVDEAAKPAGTDESASEPAPKVNAVPAEQPAEKAAPPAKTDAAPEAPAKAEPASAKPAETDAAAEAPARPKPAPAAPAPADNAPQPTEGN